MMPFKRLLHRGVVTELAVMDEINLYNVFKKIYKFPPYRFMEATSDVGLYTPHDLHIFCASMMEGKILRDNQQICTVEVKSADNGGKYDTFFAEIIQLNTMGYAEYLVHPPTWIVYVDIPTRTHYWYDGGFFVGAVKSMYKQRYQPRGLQAEGIKFPIKSEEFGYIDCVRQTQEWDEICDKYDEIIKQRLKKKRRTYIKKKCLFLPDLP